MYIRVSTETCERKEPEYFTRISRNRQPNGQVFIMLIDEKCENDDEGLTVWRGKCKKKKKHPHIIPTSTQSVVHSTTQ